MHLHSVLTVVMLFFFGLISPGPNFLVVAETTLNSGRVAGLATGLGAAKSATSDFCCSKDGMQQTNRRASGIRLRL